MTQRATEFSGNRLREVAFPLGGIGTGTVSLTGSGGLAEWQIRNHPEQDTFSEHTFFALWARRGTEVPVARVLEGPVQPPYNRHHRAVHGSRFPGGGLGNSGVFGLPRVESVTFRGAYPLAEIEYHDRALPVQVRLEAYNPMVPMDPDSSGIPCALFRFHVHNPSRSRVSLTLAMSMRNLLGAWHGGGGRNRLLRSGGISCLYFDNPALPAGEPHTGTVAVATPHRSLTWRTSWYRLDWFDPLQTMWDEFSAKGTLVDNRYATPSARHADAGTLGLRATLKPGQSVVLPVWVTWSFPTYEFPFSEVDHAGRVKAAVRKPRWTNWYAKRFPTALHVVRYLARHEDELHARTTLFRRRLEQSSVPQEVLDAASSQMSIIRSPTCIRLEDGSFYAFEGSHETVGSCPGSCTHVWNYAQALVFLYPSLQQTFHTRNYRYNFSPSGSGAMAFRIPSPARRATRVPHAAVDGQMGEIVRIYQTWRLSGDTKWLRELWPGMQKSLAFAWRQWDWRKRGVIEGVAHNTYDIEFWGPNAFGTSYYFAALEACSRIAEQFGEPAAASEYRRLIARGRAWIDRHLWNGRFYVQRVDTGAWEHGELPMRPARRYVPAMKPGEPRYQYGAGCLSDQLRGQWMGRIAGLGLQFDPAKVRRALRSIYRHNFHRRLSAIPNCQRAFALQDEGALLLCSWPDGGRPVLPFIYCDEAWTGVEYAVASHLVLEGMQREALAIVRAIAKRHDGERRNPWNQFEAGSYYARALSSWALMIAWAGFEYDGAAGMIGFAAGTGAFSSFWTAQSGWGVVECGARVSRLRVDYGRLRLRQLRLRGRRLRGRATVNGREAGGRVGGDSIYFDNPIRLAAGDVLEVR